MKNVKKKKTKTKTGIPGKIEQEDPRIGGS